MKDSTNELRERIAEIVREALAYEHDAIVYKKPDNEHLHTLTADRIVALLSEPVAIETSIDTPTGRYVQFWLAERADRAVSQVEEWFALEPDSNPQIRSLYAPKLAE